MADYDRAWEMPEENWEPQSVYQSPTAPWAFSPDAGTPVCIGPLAVEVVPYLLGLVDILRIPATWALTDPDLLYAQLKKVDLLAYLLMTARCSAVGAMLRLENCILQISNDGGMTWTEAGGWADTFGNCVRSNLPPPVPFPPGDPIQQHACNIAGFISHDIINQTVTNLIVQFNDGTALLNLAIDAVKPIISISLPYTTLFLSAVQDLYPLITAGTVAAWEAARDSSVLWSAVTCAIYNAIHLDGQVTDANWPTAVANICAITYTDPSIVAAICAFAGTVGSVNVRAYEAGAVLNVEDCLNCGPWCNEEDFRQTAGAFSVTGSGFGAYNAGVGWATTAYTVAGSTALQISAGGPGPGVHVDTVDLYVRSAANSLVPGDRVIGLYHSSALVASLSFPDTAMGDLTKFSLAVGGALVDQYVITWFADGAPGAGIIQAIQVHGPAPAPFLANPCLLP